MYSFLTVIFAVFIKLCLVQGHPQNYGGNYGGRSGYADQNIQKNVNVPPYKHFQNTNTRYYDENENIYVGNGYNRHNVVILNEGSPRYFGGGNVQPNIPKPFTEMHNQYSNKNTLQQFSPNINQKSNSDFNTRGRNFNDNPQYNDQPQSSSTRYYDDGEFISIGNGRNKHNNVVIVNGGSTRNFQDSLQPKFGYGNTNQRRRYDSKVVNINNIGNGRNNQNSVIIEDSPDGVGRTVTTIQNGFGSSHVFTNRNPTYDNQNFNNPSGNNYNHGTYNRQNRDPPNSNRDGTDFSYSQIGHGPDNSNTVIINGEVYSSPGTTVIRRKDNGFRNTEIISNNGYHSFPNDENLKVLPKKKC